MTQEKLEKEIKRKYQYLSSDVVLKYVFGIEKTKSIPKDY